MDTQNRTKISKYFFLRNVSDDPNSEPDMPEYMKNAIGPEKDETILDIGCGFGRNLVALKNRGFTQIKGIDISRESIQICRQKGIDAEIIKNISEYSINHKNEYGVIIMSHVLEHIEKKEIIDTLISVRSMLNEKGKLIIRVPNAQANTGAYWAYEDFTHTTLFTSGSLLYVLKAADFNQVDFLDVDCVEGLSFIKRILKKFFLQFYRLNRKFWNKVTSSSYHRPSIQIFSYDIKAIAK